MKPQLTFPLAFEEHLILLKEKLPQVEWLDLEINEDKLKTALRLCYDIGVTAMTIETSGSGDEGDGVYLTSVEPDHLKDEIPDSAQEELFEYVYNLAELYNPGYYNDDGGGYECKISFYPFTIVGTPYHFVTTKVKKENITVE